MNHVRPQFAGLRILAGLLALAAVPLTASAVEWRKDTDIIMSVSGNFAQGTIGQGSGLVWTPSNQQIKAYYDANFKGVGVERTKTAPFKPELQVKATGRFSARNIAKSLMSPAGLAWGLLAQPIMTELLDQACMRLSGGTRQAGDSGFDECVVSNVQVQPTKRWSNAYVGASDVNANNFSDPLAACQYWGYQVAGTVQGTYNPGSGNSQTSHCSVPIASGYGTDVQTFAMCPVGTGYRIATGQEIQQGCTTTATTGWQKAATTNAENKLTAQVEAWTQADFAYGRVNNVGKSTQLVDNLMLNNATIEAENLPTLSGPATQTQNGGTTTTTTTGGTPQTSSVTNTYNYTYNNNTVTVSTTAQTVTTNPSTGQTTTSTTTTDQVPEQSDLCKLHPEAAACKELGSVTPDTLQKTTQAVQVVAATFAGSATCPAGITFTAFSRSYTFSYQPACDVLAVLKFLFLAVAGVLSAYILADSFKV